MLLHKTMTMPTSCLSCWIAPTCDVWVREKSKHKGYDNRLENCPLEEVKHGHWIEHDVGLICSECNHYTEAMYDEPFNNEFGRGGDMKTKKTINSREKGKKGERELANRLTDLGHPSHRGNQYKGSPDSPDVVGLPGIHIECKRVENLSINNAMAQAIKDAGKDIPVVIHRTNRAEWKVTMLLEDWIKFYEAWDDSEVYVNDVT